MDRASRTNGLLLIHSIHNEKNSLQVIEEFESRESTAIALTSAQMSPRTLRSKLTKHAEGRDYGTGMQSHNRGASHQKDAERNVQQAKADCDLNYGQLQVEHDRKCCRDIREAHRELGCYSSRAMSLLSLEKPRVQRAAEALRMAARGPCPYALLPLLSQLHAPWLLDAGQQGGMLRLQRNPQNVPSAATCCLGGELAHGIYVVRLLPCACLSTYRSSCHR